VRLALDFTQFPLKSSCAIVKEYNALGDVVRTEYDALGNKVAFTDVKGGKAAVSYSTTYTYDALGRVLTQTTPFEEKDGVIYRKVERNDFDAAGNVLAQKTTNHLPGEAASYTHTASIYDSRGRVVETVIYDGDEPGSHTRYEYDDVGNRIAVYTGVTDDPGDASKPVTRTII